jgi:putative flippase GtrA
MKLAASKSAVAERWLIFNAVGVMGAMIQLSALSFFIKILHWDYFTATGLAVEAAILHNFFWHESWTWADKLKTKRENCLRRLLSFNCTTGALSILQNLFLMRAFMNKLKISCFYANLLAIISCSLFNFFISDRLVFREMHKATNVEKP